MERGTKEMYSIRRDSVKSPFSLPSGGRHHAGEGSEFSAGQEGPCHRYYSAFLGPAKAPHSPLYGLEIAGIKQRPAHKAVQLEAGTERWCLNGK